jgi:hypothetical protein
MSKIVVLAQHQVGWPPTKENLWFPVEVKKELELTTLGEHGTPTNAVLSTLDRQAVP